MNNNIVPIQTEKFEGILVKLPEESHTPTISKDGWLFWGISGSRNTGQEELPDGEWKLIGNPFELSPPCFFKSSFICLF